MAELNGLPRRTILLRHALPNAMIPTLNVTALNIAYMMGGVVIVERVFGFPGFGSLTVDAMLTLDVPLIEATVLDRRRRVHRREPARGHRGGAAQPAPPDAVGSERRTLPSGVHGTPETMGPALAHHAAELSDRFGNPRLLAGGGARRPLSRALRPRADARRHALVGHVVGASLRSGPARPGRLQPRRARRPPRAAALDVGHSDRARNRPPFWACSAATWEAGSTK